MIIGRRKISLCLILAGFFFVNKPLLAVQFEPGIGFGLEFTDNARLTVDNQLNDLITASYVGGRVSENSGPLKYDATASFNKHVYTKNSYIDQRYLNLGAGANWEMVKNRFNWILSDNFNQRPVVSLNSNTPDNLQDTNIFTFGANIDQPISARQNFRLIPMFKQYYYETLTTGNKQLSLAATWNYQMFRLTNVGLNLSTRNINYMEQVISDTRFTNLSVVVNGQRQRSTFSLNLGSTNVKRDNSDGTRGFSGFLNWLVDLSSRSKFTTNLSTELTDTSSASFRTVNSPGNGNGDDVQVTTDVIRSSVINLSYIREDALLNSSIWVRYNKLEYSENPLDRVIRAFGLQANYPVTRLLSGGAYANYNRTKQLDSQRLDKRFMVGGNLRYNFSRKLHGFLDLKYRKKESTTISENYDEYSVFASIVYGFGDVYRPTRVGGFKKLAIKFSLSV